MYTTCSTSFERGAATGPVFAGGTVSWAGGSVFAGVLDLELFAVFSGFALLAEDFAASVLAGAALSLGALLCFGALTGVSLMML